MYIVFLELLGPLKLLFNFFTYREVKSQDFGGFVFQIFPCIQLFSLVICMPAYVYVVVF